MTLVQGDLSYDIEEEISKQVHVFKLPGISLTLNPGTRFAVPLTFLPRHPHNDDDLGRPRGWDESAPPLSLPVKADLAQLVGEEAIERHARHSDRRNNAGLYEFDYNNDDEFEVRTSLVVETSRGKMEVPVFASSYKHNLYGVPQMIYFRHSPKKNERQDKWMNDVLILDTIGLYKGTFPPVKETSDEVPLHECYDVYISNPTDQTYLEVKEILVSKPDRMSLFDKNKDPKFESPKRSISTWNEKGSTIKMDKGVKDLYLATLCPYGGNNPLDLLESPTDDAPTWINDGKAHKDVLGYLQIRTDIDTLFVVLQRQPEKIAEQPPNNDLQEAIQRVVGTEFPNDMQDIPTKDSPSNGANSRRLRGKKPNLVASPRNIKHNLVASVEPHIGTPITIRNTYNETIKIMHVTLTIDKTSDADVMEEAHGMGLEISVHLRDSSHQCKSTEINCESEQGPYIRADSTLEGAFLMRSSLDSNKTIKYLERNFVLTRYTGSVVVRATSDLNISYPDWKEKLRQYPFMENHLVLEIQYTVNIIDGQIHFLLERTTGPHPLLRYTEPAYNILPSTKGLFFPIQNFKLRKWRYWEKSDDTYFPYNNFRLNHSMRILGSIPVVTNITNIRLNSYGDHKSLCERFTISINHPPIKVNKPSQFGKTGLYDMGLLHVDYSLISNKGIGDVDEKQSEAPSYTEFCYLEYETTPINTGVHILPLLVFPGRLDVTTSEFSLPEDEVIEGAAGQFNDFTSSVVTGFDKVLTWFQVSKLGQALFTYLEDLTGGRKKENLENREYQLSRYISKLGNTTTDDGTSLRPILLKVGVIGHGKSQMTSLYFTNHNPVPVTIYVDVSEVEGSSIFLARESSRARGDGNLFVDYLPSLEADSANDKIKSGKFKGHSRKGLQQFLLNPNAQAFYQITAYRDAVSMSSMALKKNALLKFMYKSKARVHFHTDKLPRHCFRAEGIYCKGMNVNPSLYNPFTTTAKKTHRDRQYPGPLLLSDDLTIAHRTIICDPPLHEMRMEEEPLDMYRHPPVMIPPGGVARFEVRIRAPSEDELEKDITPFLSTGLVLSTSHGQVMPILVVFEALLGKLKVTEKRFSSEDSDIQGLVEGVDVLDVPIGVFKESHIIDESLSDSPWLSAAAAKIKEGSDAEFSPDPRIKLYLDSSFSRKVALRKIESCNPWFHVELKEGASNGWGDVHERLMADDERVEIGTIESVLKCPPMDQLVERLTSLQLTAQTHNFPSFFQCAMAWLENRSNLQPHGCGIQPSPRRRMYVDERQLSNIPEGDVFDRALYALHHAITFSLVKYGGARILSADPFLQTDEDNEITESAGDSSDRLTYPDFAEFAVNSLINRGKELLDSLTLDVFAEITDAWRIVMDLDLHSVSTSLRATIDYDLPTETNFINGTDAMHSSGQTSPVVKRQSLTMSMKNLAARTVLELPLLFDWKRASNDDTIAESYPDEFVSFLTFPSTRIGNVASLKIPIHNPYAVPLRVRLAAASRSVLETDHSKEFPILENREVRRRYLKRLGPLYVQESRVHSRRIRAGDSWWDGDGSFFLHDDHGNLIQSRQNVTILAGAGAHVSLVDPSLFGTSSFLVGCAARCGVSENEGVVSEEDGVLSTSPIGASAAAGVYLIGRKERVQWGPFEPDPIEPFLSAGGSSSEDDAPAAFAMPYSSFDEIILPPFGNAELGPVYFRPPGRTSVLGCEALPDSKSHPWLPKAERVCASKSFETIVFLENSLTGLERVVIRGAGLWERVVFTDPEPKAGRDAFGDVEYRFGRSTLIFPGSAVNERHGVIGSTSHAVIKEFSVFNDGDIDIEFKRIFFTDATKLPNNIKRKGGTEAKRSCEYRGFRLVGCFDNEKKTVTDRFGHVTIPNLKYGFALKPGKRRTFMIEHTPDCTYRSEYVALQFEFARPDYSLNADEFTEEEAVSRSGKMRQEKANGRRQFFNRRYEEMLVGFDMTSDEMTRCVPVMESTKRPPVIIRASLTESSNATNKFVKATALKHVIILDYHLRVFYSSNYRFCRTLLIWVMFLVATCPLALLIRHMSSYRQKTSLRFRSTLRGIKKNPVMEDHGQEQDTAQLLSNVYSNWSATFRCLARADPTSSELQTLGREQVRQIVLNRYKSIGVLAPQCITGAGIFVRDRSLVGGTSGKDANLGNNGKIRTLSDSLFHRMANEGDETNGMMPCALGWKTAVARGIVSKSSRSAVRLKSAELLRKRHIIEEPDDSHDEDEDSEEEIFDEEEEDEEDEVGEDGSEDASHELMSSGVKSHMTSTDAIESKGKDSQLSDDEVESAGPVYTPNGDAVSTSDSDGLSLRDEDSQVTKSSVNSTVVVGKSVTKKDEHQAMTQIPVVNEESEPESIKSVNTEKKETQQMEAVPVVLPSSDAMEAKGSTEEVDVAVDDVQLFATKTCLTKEPREKREPTKQKRERRERDKAPKFSKPDDGQPSKKKTVNTKEISPSPASESSPKTSQSPQMRARKVVLMISTDDAVVSVDKVQDPKPTKANSLALKSLSKKERMKAPKKSKKNQSEPKAKMVSEMPLSANPSPQGPNKSILRPPPGLAPPPGFGNVDNSSTSNRTTLNTVSTRFGGELPPTHESLSQLAPILSGLANGNDDSTFRPYYTSSSLHDANSSNLFNSLLGGTNARFGESSSGLMDLSHASLPMDDDTILRGTAPASPGTRSMSDDGKSPRGGDGQPLLGLGGGFNVMDFLDSILDDPNRELEEDSNPAELTIDTSGIINESNISALPISANPWASSGVSSRAAAYGIAVDAPPTGSEIVQAFFAASPNRENSDDDPLEAMAVTLLTPASFFTSVGGDNDDDDYNSGSFFANLLGE